MALFLERPEGKEAIYERLSDAFPLLHAINTVQFSFGTTPSVLGAGIPAMSPGGGIKMMNRDRTRSATFGPSALQVEISMYEGFEDFVASVRQVLQAVAEVGTIQGVEQLSLRYIDEIRIPGVEDASGWSSYLDDRLVGPALFPNFRARTTNVTAEYDFGDGLSVQLRAALMPPEAPPTVSPAGPLRLRDSGPGPYFLLDMTGMWTPAGVEVPRFVVDDVLSICDRLHDPLHEMFEASITDRLRNEVLRREQS